MTIGESRIKIFYGMTGVNPHICKEQDLKLMQDYDLHEFGLGGVYQGTSMALECFMNDDKLKHDMFMLNDYDFKDKKVLEFGVGVGDRFETVLNMKPEHLVGIDIGFNYALIREWLVKNDIDAYIYPTLRFLMAGDFDNYFDCIYTYDVLEHTKHPDEIITTLVRLLKPGGVLAIIAPFEDCPDDYPQHLKEHKDFNFKQYIINKGLKILKIQNVTDKYHTTEGVLFEK